MALNKLGGKKMGDLNKKIIGFGDTVKCKYSGFVGIAISKQEFINGCVQWGVVGKMGKDGKYPEELEVDAGSLIVMKKAKPAPKPKTVKDEGPGGPTRIAKSMRGH